MLNAARNVESLDAPEPTTGRHGIFIDEHPLQA